MMVLPSGTRVELRQVGTSTIYEAQDGSYTYLDISNPNAPFVLTSDGTRFSFHRLESTTNFVARRSKIATATIFQRLTTH